MDLANKIAIISGASQGIGAAIARRYVAYGAKVVIIDINAEKGEELAAELSGQGTCLFMACDVSNAQDVNNAVEKTVATFGQLDIAVCNAGINHSAAFLDLEEKDFDRVLRVNLKGPFLLGQAAARVMAKQGGGSIINMSSINAIVCSPGIVPYAVSKGGMNQLTRVMALGLAPSNIRVNAIGPGSIETELLRDIMQANPDMRHGMLSRTPMGRLGQPEEIAEIAVFLASPMASYITGQVIYADGGRLPLAYNVPVAS
ncbi:SDR family NAD(P)-dependent oxidoreductase [Komagataeibacter sp. NFXK3]